jgi:hypothetical protein
MMPPAGIAPDQPEADSFTPEVLNVRVLVDQPVQSVEGNVERARTRHPDEEVNIVG